MFQRFDGKVVAEEFEKAFGYPITQLNLRQLWFLVKFAKFVRKFCRNNSAFNNYMNRNFSHARFREVSKTSERGSYMGLQISIGEETLEESGDEE